MAGKRGAADDIFAALNAIAGGVSVYATGKENQRRSGVAEELDERGMTIREAEAERMREQMDFTRQDRERMQEKRELDEQMEILGPYLDAIESTQGQNATAQSTFQGDMGDIAGKMVGRVGVGAASAGKGGAVGTPAGQPAGTVYRPDWAKIIQSGKNIEEIQDKVKGMEEYYKERGLAYVDPYGQLQNDPNAQIGPPVGKTIGPEGLTRNLLPNAEDSVAGALGAAGAAGGAGFQPMTMEDVLRDIPRLAEMLKPPKTKAKRVRPLSKAEISKLTPDESSTIKDLVRQLNRQGLDPRKHVNWKAMQKEMGGKVRVHLIRRAVISQLRQAD